MISESDTLGKDAVAECLHMDFWYPDSRILCYLAVVQSGIRAKLAEQEVRMLPLCCSPGSKQNPGSHTNCLCFSLISWGLMSGT